MARQETMTSTGVILETEECIVCGVVFAAPISMLRNRQEKGGDFYCPNGHVMVYKEPTVEKLRRQLEEERERRRTVQRDLNQALDTLAGKNKELKKLEKRVNAGVCPHCHRHFANVERHIHTKHPEALEK